MTLIPNISQYALQLYLLFFKLSSHSVNSQILAVLRLLSSKVAIHIFISLYSVSFMNLLLFFSPAGRCPLYQVKFFKLATYVSVTGFAKQHKMFAVAAH